MRRRKQGYVIAITIPVIIVLILAAAEAGMPVSETAKQCSLKFPKWFGCALANHENLSGGLIGAGGTLFAAWLAWSAVWAQITASERQASNTQRLIAEANLNMKAKEIEQLSEAIEFTTELLPRLKTEGNNPGRHALKLVDLAASQELPMQLGHWTTQPWSVPISNALHRLRNLGYDIRGRLGSTIAEQQQPMLNLRDDDALDALTEFEVAAQSLDTTLLERQSRYNEAKARLDSMPKIT